MANQLKMALVDSIITLHGHGWSRRRIARELGIHRETVGRYVNCAGPPKPASNAPIGIDPSKPASNAPTGSPSVAAAWREVIGDKLDQGLTAQRIYQDLVSDHGYAGSYYSVRRLVRKLEWRDASTVPADGVRAGGEAQVDFGRGAPIVTADGKRRGTWVFRIVLSHSRKGYSEAVSRQTTDDFLRCLENAFAHFGGVREHLVIDNLRAAVKQADWFDPELCPKVQSFCRALRDRDPADAAVHAAAQGEDRARHRVRKGQRTQGAHVHRWPSRTSTC